MDETPAWADMVSTTKWRIQVQKTITVKTTGHDKNCISVYLAAKVDGTKLPSFIVSKGAKQEAVALDKETKTIL